MLESAVAWIGANLEVTGVLLAIAVAIGGGIKWVFGLFKKKPDTPTPSQNITVEQSAAPVIIQPQPNTVHLTLEAYEERLKKARDEVLAQIPDSSGEQLQHLTNKRDEYESRLRDIEPAYEQAKARIAELEELLEREGNLLGAEELEQAEAALAKGDFDAAEASLIRIEDQGDLEVKRTARAAFGRGKIAEEQVRWLDAADHYDKAARLDPTYETLYKAGTFF
ncbi:MAG: tetratricopeptide repeat protein, partial [Pseudomonadota bacterium]